MIDKRAVISMSNSSDPYPSVERKLKLTRGCLEIFGKLGLRVQVITKSDLVTRDTDLLSEMCAMVSFTVTTLNQRLAEGLEPGAPAPAKRLSAMKAMSQAGVMVSLRLDPIFPGLNEKEIGRLVDAAADAGVKHITSSTFKPRPDGWMRFQRTFPKIAQRIAPLYFEKGKRRHNSWYLPRVLRAKLIGQVKESCEKKGLTFSACREGLDNLNPVPSCDGTHLICGG